MAAYAISILGWLQPQLNMVRHTPIILCANQPVAQLQIGVCLGCVPQMQVHHSSLPSMLSVHPPEEIFHSNTPWSCLKLWRMFLCMQSHVRVLVDEQLGSWTMLWIVDHKVARQLVTNNPAQNGTQSAEAMTPS